MKIGQPFNPQKLFIGCFLPNCLLCYPDLSPADKLIWARLSQYAGKDGKIFPKQSTLAEETGFSTVYIQQRLNKLAKQGFIKVIPPTGREKLNHKSNTYLLLWHKAFDSVSDDNLKSKKQSKSYSSAAKDSKHPRWKKFATQLHTAVLTETHVNRSHEISKWAHQFRLLYIQDKVSIQRIKSVLDWYCEELPNAEQYLPQGYCGRTFREKFSRIEDYMKKNGHQPTEVIEEEIIQDTENLDGMSDEDYVQEMMGEE